MVPGGLVYTVYTKSNKVSAIAMYANYNDIPRRFWERTFYLFYAMIQKLQIDYSSTDFVIWALETLASHTLHLFLINTFTYLFIVWNMYLVFDCSFYNYLFYYHGTIHKCWNN